MTWLGGLLGPTCVGPVTAAEAAEVLAKFSDLYWSNPAKHHRAECFVFEGNRCVIDNSKPVPELVTSDVRVVIPCNPRTQTDLERWGRSPPPES